jgi:hypothetical protein
MVTVIHAKGLTSACLQEAIKFTKWCTPVAIFGAYSITDYKIPVAQKASRLFTSFEQ